MRPRRVLTDVQHRGAAGIPGAAQHVLRGVRPFDGRHHQHVHQVGQQRPARHGLLSVPNDALTADDPFGRQAIGAGQQFGGSVGGSLKKDRTFFFVAPEFQYNTKPVEILYSTLDTQNVRNTAGAQALLAVAPEDDLDALSQSQSIVTRIDHRLGERHNLMGRFDYIRNRVTDNVGSVVMSQGLGADSITNRALSNQVLLTNRNDVTGMLQLSTVLSSRLMNEARMQITHEFRPWNTNSSDPEVTVRNAGATVAIYGAQATGLSYGNIGYQFDDVRYQFVDNLTFVTGAHTAKFGVDSNLVSGETTFNAGWNGIYTFNSLTDYLARRPFDTASSPAPVRSTPRSSRSPSTFRTSGASVRA